MSLAARYLEENGIPTVVIGSARDIVEHCGVPRFVFSDFPLGNSLGRPGDTEMQRAIMAIALRTLEFAPAPRTTVQTPFRWAEDDAWKDDFWKVVDDPEAMARAKEAFDRQKEIAKQKRESELASQDAAGGGAG